MVIDVKTAVQVFAIIPDQAEETNVPDRKCTAVERSVGPRAQPWRGTR
jgi:hypothetical protein